MPNGWSEFLEKITEQATSEDPHSIWAEFLQQSHMSPRAAGLEVFTNLVEKYPIEDRIVVAALVASLLAPLEWPPEWESHRHKLVEALETLSSIVDPSKPDSLGALLKLGPEENRYWSSLIMFLTAAHLLGTPCRRDQLRPIAQLCWFGLSRIVGTYRQALVSTGESATTGPLLDARIRFIAAFERYAQAARAINSAAGEVLFQRLDEQLNVPET